MHTLIRTITTRPTRETLTRFFRGVADWLEPQPEQAEMLESHLLFNNWLR